MHRAVGVAVVIASIMMGAQALADRIDDRIAELSTSDNYKLRLASAIALSKSADRRALLALTSLLRHAEERSLRRVAVVGLSKQVGKAPPALRAELIAALESAAADDEDARVRSSAATAARALKKLAAADGTQAAQARSAHAAEHGSPSTAVGAPRGETPRVFVNVDAAVDLSSKMTADGLARVTAQVKKVMTSKGYATTWPGALPTADDLEAHQASAYMVAPTVRKLDVKRQSERMTEVACTVSIRVAPWNGTDGKELWEAERAASASGSAKAQTGTSERDVAAGIRDCVDAVSEEISSRQIIPFLQRLAGS
jgi:HEAT repeats